jgi:hypothetical protein
VSPVRGRGWYKRPYRIAYTTPDGRRVSKAFHWKGPWEEEQRTARRFGFTDIEAWVVTNEHGQPERTREVT